MNTWLQHPGFTVLATALLHSLWLFMVPVALDWLVTRRLSHAHHRYLSHLLTVLSWPLLFALVLWTEWRAATGAWSAARLLEAELGPSETLTLTDGLGHLGVTTAPQWTVYLALAYLLGLLVALAITLQRYLVTRSIRRNGWLPQPDLRRLFTEVQTEMLPGRAVAWRITDRVSTVLLVGIIRPVILFPIGLLNQLSADEVEAILRHELTHVKRYDTLWNAVQELLRALFFYHPLVYWLCAQLDLEREYACDDAVVRETDKQIYARALLRVADYSIMPKTPMTMAAINTNSFTRRIQRLFTPSSDRVIFARSGDSRSYLLPPLAILPFFFLFTFGTASEHPYRMFHETSDAVAPVEAVILRGTIYGGPESKPLIGATFIAEDGTGTITDLYGNYEIRLEAGQQKIAISYVGYQSMVIEATVTKDARADFQLYADRAGRVKATSGPFSFQLLSEAEMPPTPEKASATDMGVISDDLLVILDGNRQEKGSLKDLDPKSIEKIEVIKDKKSMAKLGYGTEFNGAVLITTKRQE